MDLGSIEGLIRVVVVGTVAYVGIVFVCRTSGKRTLSKFNAFDFIVTIALGSTLSSVMTSKTVPLGEGLLAIAVLVGLQYAVAWLAVRSDGFRKVIKSEPRLLAFRGEIVQEALRDERVTPEEVQAALRQCGLGRLQDAAAIVLETDGTMSVVRRDGPSLRSVRGADAVR